MELTFRQRKSIVYRETILGAINGGMVSAITFESFMHAAVGYATGNFTFIASYLVHGEIKLFLSTFFILMSFLLGAILSGIITSHKSYVRYDISFLIEGLFIFIATIGLIHGVNICMYLLAIALGLQNGATTYYGNSIIRTTHMTGTITDLGIAIAQKFIKNYDIPSWKLIIYSLLILGFLFGSILGIVLFYLCNYKGLFISVALCLFIAIERQFIKHESDH